MVYATYREPAPGSERGRGEKEGANKNAAAGAERDMRKKNFIVRRERVSRRSGGPVADAAGPRKRGGRNIPTRKHRAMPRPRSKLRTQSLRQKVCGVCGEREGSGLFF